MKVLFVGLGSIGARHARLLRTITPCDIVSYRSGRGHMPPDVDALGPIHCVDDMQQAFAERPDFAVIANPTALHAETALSVAKAGIPFLLEKPVSHSMDHVAELCAVVEHRRLPVMVGFQLRHHPAYRRVRELLAANAIGKIVCLQSHVGQYLPDWRPEADYRASYSAHRALGGGVMLDLCHAIDVALAVMGPATQVSCVAGHYSDLATDAEDCVEMTLEHAGNTVSHIHLNCIERGYQWWTRIVGVQGTIVWDYGSRFVEIIHGNGQRQRWDDDPVCDRDMVFTEQLRCWLRVLRGDVAPMATLADGVEVTRVVVTAKQAAAEGRRICL